MSKFNIFLSLVVFANFLAIFYVDVIYRVVKHRLIFVTLLLCTVSCIINSANIFNQLFTAFFVFSIFFLLWLMNVLGGSDVKLIGSVFIGIKPEYSQITLLVIGLFGGVQIILMWVYGTIRRRSAFKHGVPYTIPIGVSGWIFFTLSLC